MLSLFAALLAVQQLPAQNAAVEKQKADVAARLKSRITVGKDTTFFTEPVDKDGYVDYIAALN
jgi:hypothetical protein